jgi:hypothetical protein
MVLFFPALIEALTAERSPALAIAAGGVRKMRKLISEIIQLICF